MEAASKAPDIFAWASGGDTIDRAGLNRLRKAFPVVVLRGGLASMHDSNDGSFLAGNPEALSYDLTSFTPKRSRSGGSTTGRS